MTVEIRTIELDELPAYVAAMRLGFLAAPDPAAIAGGGLTAHGANDRAAPSTVDGAARRAAQRGGGWWPSGGGWR